MLVAVARSMFAPRSIPCMPSVIRLVPKWPTAMATLSCAALRSLPDRLHRTAFHGDWCSGTSYIEWEGPCFSFPCWFQSSEPSQSVNFYLPCLLRETPSLMTDGKASSTSIAKEPLY